MLSQSDIFSHFGTVKLDTSGAKPVSKSGSATGLAKSASNSNLGRSRRGRAASEELDEDEKAMAREEDDSEEGGAEEETHTQHRNAHLTKQPSCITGGQMRYGKSYICLDCTIFCHVCACVLTYSYVFYMDTENTSLKV